MPVIRENRGSFELEESFCRVEIDLFDALVAYPLDDDVTKLASHMSSPKRSLPRYRVELNAVKAAPMLINREYGKSSGYWDHRVAALASGEAELAFVEFFDFPSDAHRDYRYIMVEVLASEKYPDIIGHFALVDTELVRVFKAEQHARQVSPGAAPIASPDEPSA